MTASLPHPTPYPTLGYLTRRQPPGSGIPPGTELPLELEAAMAG